MWFSVEIACQDGFFDFIDKFLLIEGLYFFVWVEADESRSYRGVNFIFFVSLGEVGHYSLLC